jgi:hypothetical protein
VGPRVPEVGEDAVAEELGDEAVVALDGRGDRLLVSGEKRAQVLRVEGGGQRGGADEVAEHDSEVATLGVAGEVGDRPAGNPGAEGGDGVEELLPGAEGQAEILEIGVGEPGQDGPVDLVLGEEGLILRQAEADQPIDDRVHAQAGLFITGRHYDRTIDGSRI